MIKTRQFTNYQENSIFSLSLFEKRQIFMRISTIAPKPILVPGKAIGMRDSIVNVAPNANMPKDAPEARAKSGKLDPHSLAHLADCISRAMSKTKKDHSKAIIQEPKIIAAIKSIFDWHITSQKRPEHKKGVCRITGRKCLREVNNTSLPAVQMNGLHHTGHIITLRDAFNKGLTVRIKQIPQRLDRPKNSMSPVKTIASHSCDKCAETILSIKQDFSVTKLF